MIITIDGPAGAGKTTAAKGLARRLGFRFLDTGATYRAVTLAAIRRGIDWGDADGLVRTAERADIEVDGQRILLDGADVSDEIRGSEITAVTHYVADNPDVRERMVTLQRRLAGTDDIVTEGRDQGTVVFPDAACKVFLTAGAEERARRRLADLTARGETADLRQVLADQNERDRRDSARDCGPLVSAADAIEVVTDGMSPEEVLNRLEELARGRMSAC